MELELSEVSTSGGRLRDGPGSPEDGSGQRIQDRIEGFIFSSLSAWFFWLFGFLGKSFIYFLL